MTTRTKAFEKRNLPTQPLIDAIKRSNPHSSDETLAEVFGVSRAAYRKMIVRDSLNWVKADLYATRLGLHPVLIWDNWYEATALDGE